MILEVKNGSFAYPGQELILKDINFILKEKEILSVLGQNGVGKTTMIKCLTGILKWKRGSTFIDGEPLDAKKQTNQIGYVPQAHYLSFPYTVEEMVSMGRSRYVGLFSVPSKKDKQRVNEVLQEIGIEHIKDIPCTHLSGGQLQLVYIARAIVSDPKVLIFDEPESHLDYKNQLMILNLIKNIVKKNKISCIINTHHPDHAMKISDKTLFIGKNDYVFGNTTEVITESNLKKYLEIKAKIFTFSLENQDLKSVIALP